MMATPAGRLPRSRNPAIAEAVLDAVADMVQRVHLNGPEATYATEKLGRALYKAAEALGLCGVQLNEVIEDARRGHGHGAWIREVAA